jgi:lipopolysaccharide transport system ATP-binding protein
MRRSEIDRQFDAIVDFAEVEQFLDTPVKRYSSGMYVRLAFAVAAHLNPEILVVDEVLAVGDVQFQKKCLGKMGEVAREGRTILFVSHNMGAVTAMCQKALLLKNGTVLQMGPVDEIKDLYLSSLAASTATEASKNLNRTNRPISSTTHDFTVKSVELLDENGNSLTRLMIGDGMIVRITYHSNSKIVAPAFMISIRDRQRVELVRLSTMPISGYYIDCIDGTGVVELFINKLPFTGGTYHLDIGVGRANVERFLLAEEALTFVIEPSNVYGSGFELDNTKGLCALEHQWRHIHSAQE